MSEKKPTKEEMLEALESCDSLIYDHLWTYYEDYHPVLEAIKQLIENQKEVNGE